MNRRGFLTCLVPALALDPERLLWRPDAKLISIPRPTGNRILTPEEYSAIVYELFLIQLESSLVLRRPARHTLKQGKLYTAGARTLEEDRRDLDRDHVLAPFRRA